VEERTDLYLATGRDDLGIKMRPDADRGVHVETKYRVGALGGLHVVPGVIGSLERWTKLSVAGQGTPSEAAEAWIAVHKQRRTRRFTLVHGDAVELDPGAVSEHECNVELTRLEVRHEGKEHVDWTLGFETLAAPSGALALVQAACRAVFEDASGQALHGARSMGYAAWLADG